MGPTMAIMLADPRRQQGKVRVATTYIIAPTLAIFRHEIPAGARRRRRRGFCGSGVRIREERSMNGKTLMMLES
jgi:hypothetical protein